MGLALTLFQTRFSFSVAHRLSGIMWTYHFSQNLEQLRGRTVGEFSQKSMVGQGICQYIHGGVIAVDNRVFCSRRYLLGLLAYEPVVLVSVAILVGFGTIMIRRLNDDSPSGLRSNSKRERALRPTRW